MSIKCADGTGRNKRLNENMRNARVCLRLGKMSYSAKA